jgi:hypothetical protein
MEKRFLEYYVMPSKDLGFVCSVGRNGCEVYILCFLAQKIIVLA